VARRDEGARRARRNVPNTTVSFDTCRERGSGGSTFAGAINNLIFLDDKDLRSLELKRFQTICGEKATIVKKTTLSV
jgi:hypothetical protein